MRLKKVLAVGLAAVMGISLVACGGGNKKDSKEKTYKIASDTTFTPFEFEDKDGNRVGIDLYLLEAIAKEEGFKYKVTAVGFDAAMASVESGQSDGMIAGMSITKERKQKYDFSEAYYDSKVAFAVKKGGKTFDNIKDKKKAEKEALSSLKGKTVAAKVGTVGATYANENAEKYGYKVRQFKDSPTMYQAVLTGNAAACFEDFPVISYQIGQKNLKLQVAFTSESGSQYGFAVKKGKNSELVEKFNSGLKKIKDNGKYQEIVDKYTKTK